VAGALLVGMPIFGTSLEATRTAVSLYVTLGQLVFAYPARTLTVFLPSLRELLGLVPLRADELALVIGAVGATWLGAEFVSRALRPDAPHPAPSPAA